MLTAFRAWRTARREQLDARHAIDGACVMSELDGAYPEWRTPGDLHRRLRIPIRRIGRALEKLERAEQVESIVDVADDWGSTMYKYRAVPVTLQQWKRP